MKLRSLVFKCFGAYTTTYFSLFKHQNGADQPPFNQGRTTSAQYTLPGLGAAIGRKCKDGFWYLNCYYKGPYVSASMDTRWTRAPSDSRAESCGMVG